MPLPSVPQMADKADRTSFSTGFHGHHNAVAGLINGNGGLPAFRISMAPIFLLSEDRHRSFPEARMTALGVDGVSVTFSILGDNAHNLAVFGD